MPFARRSAVGRFVPLLFGGWIAVAFYAPAEAQTLEACLAEQRQCDQSCARRYDTEAGKVGCQARCASLKAACDAKAGYDSAKPWVDRQKRSVEDFWDGLTNDGSTTPAKPKTPPAKPSGTGSGAADDKAI